MNKIFSILLVLTSLNGVSQNPGYIRYDSTFFGGGVNSVLILNKAVNKDSTGFVLTNLGHGVTGFMLLPSGNITANNGLVKSSDNIQLGGVLTQNTIVTPGAFSLTFSSSTASGLFFNRTAAATSGAFNVGNLVTNSTTGNTFSDGFGGLLEWENKGINGLFRNIAGIEGVRDGNDSSGRLKFLTFNAGALGSVGEVSKSGQWTYPNYTGSSFYGTLTHRLGIDASGNLIQDTTTLATNTALSVKLDKIDSIGLTGFRSVGSANKTRDSLVALITTAGSQSLQAVTNVGNVTTKSIYADSLVGNNGYLRKNSLVGNSSYTSTLGILLYCYGNSITAGTASTKIQYAYPSIIAGTYGIGQSGITNYGIGGSVIDTFFTLPHPTYTSNVRYVTMMWGGNELTTGWDTGRYHTAYKRAIDTLISKGYPLNKIIIFQLTPIAGYSNGSQFAYIDSVTAVQKGVRFVPLYYYLLNNNYFYMLLEGVHPVDVGHELIASRIISVLNDSDVTGLSTVLNIANVPFINTGIINANSGGFNNDIMIDKMLIGNKGDSTSTFVGFRNSIANVPGSILSNVFIGTGNGLSNISGSQNTSIGYQALYFNTTGSSNTAGGLGSLFSNTTGNYNSALGVLSLHFNTSGVQNSAIGYQVLYSNTTGSNNVASGFQSMTFNTTGSNNVASGFQSMNANVGGNYNVATGFQSLLSNTTGINNTANGAQSLLGNNIGNNNTAIGFQSMLNNITGGSNNAIGFQSLYSDTSGNQNVANGFQALYSNLNGTQNTALGYQSMYFNKSSNNTATGFRSLYSNTTGTQNTAHGFQSLFSDTTGSNNTAFGYDALQTVISVNDLTAIGNKALQLNTIGTASTAVGSGAAQNNTTGNYNTAIGINSFFLNTVGSSNSAVGRNSLFNNNADNNTGIGAIALFDNTSGTNNTAIGFSSGRYNYGSGNTTIGYQTDLPYNISNGANLHNTIFILNNNGHDSVASTTSLVGIGTINPSGKLDVRSGDAGASTGDFVVNTPNTFPSTVIGRLSSTSNSSVRFYVQDRVGNIVFSVNNGNNTGTAGSSNFLCSLGIGTAVPSFTLDVNGRSRTVNQARFDSSLKVAILPSGANTDSLVTWRASDSTVRKIVYSGVSGYAHNISTPTTGGTVTLTRNQYNIINPAGALLALTVNLPSSPSNNDVVYIKFTQNVTTVTYGNGTVVDGITAPTAGGLTVLTYDSGTTSWY